MFRSVDQRARRASDETFALSLLPRELARAADRLGLLAISLLGRLFIGSPLLHLAENALTLHFLFQDAESLIDIVVTNEYLQWMPSFMVASLPAEAQDADLLS